MNEIHYLETGSQNPFYNLAFEEYVLRNRVDGEYLMLWQNENTIVIGRNQNAMAEINHSFVTSHGIHVVRRITGGGAVYHDLGNLNYSFITDAGDTSQLSMTRFTAPIVAALKSLGLDAEASGRNDILVEGKKVSGTAQCIIDGRILHHGTLLFDSNPEMIAQALNVDPRKFQSKSSKSVRSRVGNIRSFLREDMDIREFWDYLKKFLSGSGFRQDKLNEIELKNIEDLEKTIYNTWQWNFGHSPKFDLINRNHFEGGLLEIGIHAESGRIAEIRFFGDFLAVSPVKDVENALLGCPLRVEDVENVLKTFDLRLIFGGISCEEILKTIFCAADK